MSQIFPRFELENVLRSDVADILAAREKARILHHSRDIRSAGDEVEQTVRKVLRRKLPISYYVGHGHIVDQQLSTSNQLDVIIAENAGTPILFRAENGSEYFPYEAVYAIGEVKSSYKRSERYIHKFADKLADIRSNLYREEKGVDTIIPARYGNLLFSFMLFAHSGNFKIKDILELYQARPEKELPTLACFLDRGLILNALVPTLGSTPDDHKPMRTIDIAVTYLTHELLTMETVKKHWVFASYGISPQYASNFGFFFYKLAMHLQKCTLLPPNLLMYHSHMLGSPTSTIIT